MKEKCLILGGGGFIGSQLVSRLLESGYEVRIFDVKNFSKKNISEFIDKIEIIEGDFSNPVDVENAVNGVDYVYHLISTTLPANSLLNPIYDVESNLVPTIHLLQSCVDQKIKKVVFISSGGTVYGIPEVLPIKENHASNPINSYGVIKRTIESYLKMYNKLYNLNVCIFRLSNPYGEKQNPMGNQGVIPVFLYKAIHNQTIEIWGNGSVIRDYIYINDVVNVLTKAVSIDTPELIYNLGSGIGTSLNDILSLIRQIFNYNIDVKYLEGRAFDVPSNVLDVNLLKERFDVGELVDLKAGIISLHSVLINDN